MKRVGMCAQAVEAYELAARGELDRPLAPSVVVDARADAIDQRFARDSTEACR